MTDERIRGRSVLQLNRSAPTDVLKRPKIYPQDNIRLRPVYFLLFYRPVFYNPFLCFVLTVSHCTLFFPQDACQKETETPSRKPGTYST
jgi:hypothetical protein